VDSALVQPPGVAGLEPLEPRLLLSAVFNAGLLTLTGTSGADRIELRAGAADGEVSVRGVEGVDNGTVFSGVDRIDVLTLGGQRPREDGARHQ
jgi:hypothetical protein